jgi:hypothetical protein
LPFGPRTLAHSGEWFPVVADPKRKVFDIRYPTSDDSALTTFVAKTNVDVDTGSLWVLTKSERHSAKEALDECRQSYLGYKFVRDAFADELQPIDEANDPWYR